MAGEYTPETRVSRKQGAIDLLDDAEQALSWVFWKGPKAVLHWYADVGTNIATVTFGEALSRNARQAAGKVICVFAPLILIGIFGS